MRLSKIYTKIGDKGETLLANGTSVPKDHVRVEAYGSVDELNSWIGYLADTLQEKSASTLHSAFVPIVSQLRTIQNELFDIGGELSFPKAAPAAMSAYLLSAEKVKRLEDGIDAFNEHLSPLENFVLPGGAQANSICHLARTVCRRAERRLITLATEDTVRGELIMYLNRLSDWLFVLSRVLSKELQVKEVLWQQPGKEKTL